MARWRERGTTAVAEGLIQKVREHSHPLHLAPEGARVPETYPWGL
jgi:hypothetical protein